MGKNKEDGWLTALFQDTGRNYPARDYRAEDLDQKIKYTRRSAGQPVPATVLEYLASEYELSIRSLNERISALKSEMVEMKTSSVDPNKDPGIIALKDRLKPLVEIKKDLLEISKEVSGYYHRNHWRSAAFTCSKKPAYIKRFAPYIFDKDNGSIHPVFSIVNQPSHS
jgi:hypothetical protein